MIYRVIGAAVARKVSSFVRECRSLVLETETEVKRITKQAENEADALRDRLVSKIAGL